MDDDYYITVTFFRSRADDGEVVRSQREDEGEVTSAELLGQFAEELQSAYGPEVGMAGVFVVGKINDRPLSDEETKAVIKGVENARKRE